MMAHAYNNLSFMYWQKYDTSQYLKYYYLAVEANKKGKDVLAAIILNNSRASFLMGENKLDSAIYLCQVNIKLLDTAKSIGNGENYRPFWRGIVLNQLADCYMQQQKYQLAIQYLNKAAQYDEQTADFSDHNYQRYRLLSRCYISLGKRDSSLKYLQLFADESAKVIYNFDPKKLSNVTHKYETEKNSRKIENLESENKLQHTKLTAVLLILSILLLSGFFIIKTLMQRKKLALELAKKEALFKEELHKQNEIQLRSKISRDLHDDVGSTLSSVKAYSEILNDNPDNLVVANLIKEDATEMIERLEVIAWAANPEDDSFGSFINKVHRFANSVCHYKNIQLNINTSNISNDIIMPGEIRQNLYLVIKEAINNTAKYSSATSCNINAAISSGRFIIEISDNGKGFDDTMKGTGHGLNNIQSRIKEIGGELTLASIPRVGTQLKAQLPYPFQIAHVG
jgi:signal transduction histidine kinase